MQLFSPIFFTKPVRSERKSILISLSWICSLRAPQWLTAITSDLAVIRFHGLVIRIVRRSSKCRARAIACEMRSATFGGGRIERRDMVGEEESYGGGKKKKSERRELWWLGGGRRGEKYEKLCKMTYFCSLN